MSHIDTDYWQSVREKVESLEIITKKPQVNLLNYLSENQTQDIWIQVLTKIGGVSPVLTQTVCMYVITHSEGICSSAHNKLSIFVVELSTHVYCFLGVSFSPQRDSNDLNNVNLKNSNEMI